jgi:hypothetical protein
MEQIDFVTLCEQISASMCQVLVGGGNKVKSAGTGVFVEGGVLYTAAHVLFHPNGQFRGDGIAVRGPKYMTGLPSKWAGPMRITPDEKLMRPIPVDLAVLKPSQIPNGVVPLPLCSQLARVGTEVLIAGYPDDIKPPLGFHHYLETMNPDIAKLKSEFERGMMKYFRPSMFKRCMIGSIQTINMNDEEKGVSINGAEYWLDNHLTYGGSGGPMVNTKGELVGIVVQKGLTDAKKFGIRSIDPSGVQVVPSLPSGIGLALSHQFLTTGLEAGVLKL